MTAQPLGSFTEEVIARKPVVHATYPLSRISDAVAELEERRAVGKVVVVPDADT